MNTVARSGTGFQLDNLICLSGLEGVALLDLLSHGCRLYYQRGKVRLSGDPQVQPLNYLSDVGVLKGPYPFDSVGVDMGSLPVGVGIIDIDDASLAGCIRRYLEGEALCQERTPSGGLHVWGRRNGIDLPRTSLCQAGVPLEYFQRGRLTILGTGRSILQWEPLGQLGNLPTPLLPGKASIELQVPIPSGRRWNTFYGLIGSHKGLEEETLIFQARFLCSPPLEENKVQDLLGILRKKRVERESQNQSLDEGEALEEVVSQALSMALGDRWIFRLPEKEWYAYMDGHWSTHDGTDYDLMNEIELELGKLKAQHTAAHRKRMGTLLFRKLMEEHMRQRLYKAPKPLKGVHFTNGLLGVQGQERSLMPSDPVLWSFHQCGIAYSECTRLTEAQKSFLLCLTNGDPLKLNVIRAYLRLLFTHDNSEQFCLYLWGPGATGKSTFMQLLEHILGDAAGALDLLRLTNRFEMRAIQDKIFLTLPDIPLKVNDAQCSLIKRFVSGDKVVIEIKNGAIYGVSVTALLLVTSNTRWQAQDRTSGFRRRILYVLTPRAAPQRDPFLLKKLKEDSSGLINWALDMPNERARIGQSVDAINELSGGGRDSSGILDWLFDDVRYSPDDETYLGAKKVPSAGSLYESYLFHVDTQGVEPLTYYCFGDVLEDTLRSIGYQDLVIKRRAQGRIVVGVTLNEKRGVPLKRNNKSETVKYLMETEPWEGFQADMDAFHRLSRKGREETLEEAAGVGDVGSVDCVDCVDSFEVFRVLEKSGGSNQPGKETGCPTGSKGDLPHLTDQEEDRTMAFLDQYPELRRAREKGETWTEDQIIQWAVGNLKVKGGIKESIRDLYTQAENTNASTSSKLPFLVPSTTLPGTRYPLSGTLERGMAWLEATPSRYKELVDLLNKESEAITDLCYILFRLFGPGAREYFYRRCPAQHLFATSYGEGVSYSRLVPKNNHGSATLANLRRDLKGVLCEVINRLLLPDDLTLDEIDMVACHTGIYAGLMGKSKAPRSWAAYESGSFWPFVMERWGNGCPKHLLKKIIYSGLNGASLTSQAGSIPSFIEDAYKENVSPSVDLMSFQRMVLGNPIFQELALFHEMLGPRKFIHLPSQTKPYYGKEEEALTKRNRSLYHNGLLTSRIFASDEVVLLMYLINYLEEEHLGIPLSLENDGFVHLTKKTTRGQTLQQLGSFLRQHSLSFLGLSISVERKDRQKR